MTLKTATNLVIISLLIGLIIGFLQWIIYTISYFKYSDSAWRVILSSGTGLVLLLIHTVPLMIFFSVLKSKQ
jgi:L-cystine uptake protein TcyP (sodium:dicarboxylate symporter family)